VSLKVKLNWQGRLVAEILSWMAQIYPISRFIAKRIEIPESSQAHQRPLGGRFSDVPAPFGATQRAIFCPIFRLKNVSCLALNRHLAA
jgi:hypothetical protein